MIAVERIHKAEQLSATSDQSSGRGLARVSAVLMLWINRSRQRRALSHMQDYLLKDIGISRVDALQESRKPFWKA